jgi:hypothetical protein
MICVLYQFHYALQMQYFMACQQYTDQTPNLLSQYHFTVMFNNKHFAPFLEDQK